MKKKILLVDDHEDFRAAVKSYLKMQVLDLDIYEANTGEMGVIKASCLKPDIVLMDINLPNITGLEAARHIKEDHPDCNIIILTVFDVESFRQAANKIIVKDFIGKNDIYDRLLPTIKKCLEGKEISNKKVEKVSCKKI